MRVHTPEIMGFKRDIEFIIGELRNSHYNESGEVLDELKYDDILVQLVDIKDDLPMPGHITYPTAEASIDKMQELQNKWHNVQMELLSVQVHSASDIEKKHLRRLNHIAVEKTLWFQSFMAAAMKEMVLNDASEMHEIVKKRFPPKVKTPPKAQKAASTKSKTAKK